MLGDELAFPDHSALTVRDVYVLVTMATLILSGCAASNVSAVTTRIVTDLLKDQAS